ncbi:MAG: hypothetical protein QMD36_00050 [Candidatus Aenigmarchaeota archaeon]|nr:hypothetical protein [Candidatus Aenigmarchaeota archaeon]
MSLKLCKAQMFSADFMIACSIFLLALVVVMIYWSYTNIQIKETKTINEMVDKAYTISQVWFREGTPEYWDSTDVREIGLLSDHRLNETKMNEMKKIGYNTVKEKIGAAPYEFRFRITLVGDSPIKEPIAYLNGKNEQHLDIILQLNQSDLVWDFYQGHSNVDPDKYITAKNHYTDGFSQQNLMRKIIQNIDNYNSIILEHPEDLDDVFLDSNEKKILKDWVNISGHAFLQINNNLDFLKIFGLIDLGPPTVNIGTVNSSDSILKNVNIGDDIQFQLGCYPFDNTAPPYPMKTIMYKQGDPQKCIFCRWWYGNGTIYYVADTATPGHNPIVGLKPLGYSFVFGEYPDQARNVIKVERAGILNSSIAIIEVLLWR